MYTKKHNPRNFPPKIKAVAIVDDKPPKLDVSIYYKPRDLLSDAMRIRELDQENLKLLRNMNLIFRQKPQTDCWNLNMKYESKCQDRESNNKSILLENKKLLTTIRNVSSQYPTKAFIQDWKDMHLKLKRSKTAQGDESKTARKTLKPYNSDICMASNAAILSSMNPAARTKCFFEIQIADTKQILGKIIFKLYADIVPRTCANFEAFCRGTHGLSYKNTPFHRILSGYWCQGGDVTMFDGTGGTSIYGNSFENENFDLRHAGRGVLSMYNQGDAENDSKFNLTFKSLETMDGHRTVFGKIVSGFAILQKIEGFGTRSGKPTKKIIVSNCGVL